MSGSPHPSSGATMLDMPADIREGETWHAVETLHRRETAALVRLAGLGYRCWLPLCRAREDKPMTPLFAGYVLFALDGRLPAPRRDTGAGILGPVRFGQSLGVLTPDAVAGLRRMLLEAGGVPVLNPRNKFEKGQRLRAFRGPFEGLEGVLEDRSEARVKVLLDMLGGRVPVHIPIEDVQAV